MTSSSRSKLINLVPKQSHVIFMPIVALKSITSKSNLGVYASSDLLFKGAVFGRDSLDVADDLMNIRPNLVKKILLTLGSLQGLRVNSNNEEEPGKIIHEYRTTVVDGKPIDDASLTIFKNLSAKWGGNDQELAYYGSVDATPHFLQTLSVYCQSHGRSILKSKINQRDGQSRTMLSAVDQASRWLAVKLKQSRSGLIEYQKVNPAGISNQVWKDSEEFYVHENKQLANHHAPIASIEVQGLAYDALLAAAEFLPTKADQFQQLAKQLRQRTIELLWLPDKQRFALGTDFDESGQLRIIKTETANPAALLDSRFFDDLPPNEQQTYVAALVNNILGPNFLTDAGIRSRSLAAANLVDHWDYHGSYVSWPKETYDIAKGLRRQGMPLLANQLENRLINVYLKSWKYPEFIYVDGHGRVLATSAPTKSHGKFTLIDAHNRPERVQAWTVSAIIAILSRRFDYKNILYKSSKPEAWLSQLEKHILSSIPDISLYFNPFSLIAHYPTYRYKLRRS